MGKRKKTSRGQIKKAAKPKMEVTFPCPYCSEEQAVECKIDRTKQIGTATCRSCQAGYQTVVNYLTDPVDIVAEWVDAIEQQRLRKQERKKRLLAEKETQPDTITKQETSDGDDKDRIRQGESSSDEDFHEFDESDTHEKDQHHELSGDEDKQEE